MAKVKISELPATTTPTTGDLVPVVQSSATKKITRGDFLKNADADATFTDITTNNSSTTKHGFLKKLDNNAAHFMDGQGNWSTPPDTTYTDEQAQDAVGGILDDGGDIDFTYNDGVPSITALVKSSAVSVAKLATGAKTGTIKFDFQGGGSVLTTGDKGPGAEIYIPIAITITKATLVADQSGSIVIDVWKDSYANYPPTVADTITASAKPTLSSAIKSQDSTLTGWTTSVAADSFLRCKIDSVSTITAAALYLDYTKA